MMTEITNKTVSSENRGGGQDKIVTYILLKLSRRKEESKGQRERRIAELGMISCEPRREKRVKSMPITLGK